MPILISVFLYLLGTDDLIAYLEKYSLTLDDHYNDILGVHQKKQWSRFQNPQNHALVSEEALDLLSQMLKYDHAERIAPKDAMQHPYFKPVMEYHAKNSK